MLLHQTRTLVFVQPAAKSVNRSNLMLAITLVIAAEKRRFLVLRNYFFILINMLNLEQIEANLCNLTGKRFKVTVASSISISIRGFLSVDESLRFQVGNDNSFISFRSHQVLSFGKTNTEYCIVLSESGYSKEPSYI